MMLDDLGCDHSYGCITRRGTLQYCLSDAPYNLLLFSSWSRIAGEAVESEMK